MRPLRCFLAVAALWGGSALAQSTPQQPGAAPSTPTVAGWIETVTFPEYGITLDAKLDTGAVSSSVSVSGLERFKRAEVKDVLRPIVRLKVCVAGHEAVTDFNLTDRSSQDYQVLIGRKFLGGRVLVDAGHTHVAAKPCGGGT
jgi:hypothetical protein